MRLILALALLVGSLHATTCTITSDSTPPPVNAGATHSFTASSGCTAWSVTGPGSINASTGVYTAPATVWAQDVSRGWQLLPNDSAYKLPINALPVDSRGAYWLQRVADNCPTCVSYHTFKLAPPQKLNFYDNVVTNSTPVQAMHFSNAGASFPYQNTNFPIPPVQNLSMQNGWSQDILAGGDRHMFAINVQTGDDAEIYNIFSDYQTIVITPGNPTSIAYTTHTIRTLQNPIRVYITGITAGCSILNGNYLAAVVSQVPGTSGVLTVPVNTTGLNCAAGTPKMTGCAGSVAGCNICNSIGGQHWFPYSNTITGGTDAAGSPLSASSAHPEEWWNVVQQNILDPACNCVTLGHALRTTLSNSYISPRDIWPSIFGHFVTGGHPNNSLPSVVIGTTTTFTTTANISTFNPCSGFTYTVGCTFKIVIGNQGAYTGTWSAANGSWTATAVDNSHFTIPLNSTGFPALPSGGTFIFDWMPYGTHIRLKASFNVAGFCTGGLTTKCPYEKAILNTLQVYGMMPLDGTLPGDNWDSGLVSSEFFPDQLLDARNDMVSNPAFQGIEQYLEVADISGQQVNFQAFTDPTNQIGLTNHNRVTVTVTCGGCTPASIDVQLQGTAVGTDHERISMVAGTSYTVNSWVTGNSNPAVTMTLTPAVSGATCCAGGVLTAPSTLPAVTRSTVVISSVADPTANAYVDVYFIPVSPDGKIRLALGQQRPSYTDTSGNVWWGQVVTRGFNSYYENAEGIGFTGLLGTWDAHSSSWSGTIDAQLYAMSTSSQNDTNLTLVVPNGNYNLTLYGEPGFGITSAGHNVYDAEIQGTVQASYQDGFLLAGSVYHPYTAAYTATVAGSGGFGLLQFNGRVRVQDTAGYGMSLSSLLLAPGGGCSLSITTTSVPNWGVNVPYSQTLTATCGTLPYTWAVISGALPTGLTLSLSGTISGTPTAPGTYNFTVKVKDAVSAFATQPLKIIIQGPTPPTLSMGAVNEAILNGAVK